MGPQGSGKQCLSLESCVEWDRLWALASPYRILGCAW